jgi:hypothetical protein
LASRAWTSGDRGSAAVWDPRGADAGDGREAAARRRAATRRRGAIGLAAGLAAAAILHWLRPARPAPPLAVAAIALAFAGVAFASPLGLYPRLQGLLDRLGRAAGAAVTWVLMTLLFFLFVLPVGAVLRAAGKLSLTRGFDPRRPSYWSAPRRPDGADAYRKQF